MQYISEREIDALSSDAGKHLAKEKRVQVVVTTEHGEPFWEGGINGCFFRIKTGEPVLVPKSLSELIAQSTKVRLESSQRMQAYEKRGRRVG